MPALKQVQRSVAEFRGELVCTTEALAQAGAAEMLVISVTKP